MKRIAVSIINQKHPEVVYLGYALSNEISETAVNFFSTVKFRPDEELEVRVDRDGDVSRYSVVMTQLHEQISSGKIMNAVPDAEHPFPARTFYRCFTKPSTRVLAPAVKTETATSESTETAATVTSIEPAAEISAEITTDTQQAA